MRSSWGPVSRWILLCAAFCSPIAPASFGGLPGHVSLGPPDSAERSWLVTTMPGHEAVRCWRSKDPLFSVDRTVVARGKISLGAVCLGSNSQ